MARLKVCKACKVGFLPVKPMQAVCGPRCAIQHSTLKNAKARDLERKRGDRKRRDAVKTQAEWAKEAQTAFNGFIRARDHGLDCPSCGATEEEVARDQGWKPGGAWDAGHWRSRGAASHLRFNTLNVHRQCKSCNGGSGKWGHTNNKAETISQAYRVTLVDRIGPDRVEQMENDNEPRTFDIDYLKRVKAMFTRRAKHYRKLRGLV